MAAAEPGSPSSPVVIPGKNRPGDSPFKQQRMPAWQPVLSAPWVTGCLFIVAVILMPLGGAVIATSDAIVQVRLRYDNAPECAVNFTCTSNHQFDIPKRMEGNIFLYYELRNFYQNHRQYAKSKSDQQLTGNEVGVDDLTEDCNPFRKPGQYRPLSNPDKMVKFDSSVNTAPVDVTTLAYNPCGLIAWSMFNDTINLIRTYTNGSTDTTICKGDNYYPNGDIIDVSIGNTCFKQGIQWPADPGFKYKPPRGGNSDPDCITNAGWPQATLTTFNGTALPYNEFVRNGWYIDEIGHKVPNVTDLDFMVWSRLASTANFQKLYRIIKQPLEVGTYRFNIFQRFPVRRFEGEKWVVLSTSSWIGGKNYFLGILYLSLGGVCLILAFAFFGYWAVKLRGHRFGGARS